MRLSLRRFSKMDPIVSHLITFIVGVFIGAIAVAWEATK
jgi:hypothetical protein